MLPAHNRKELSSAELTFLQKRYCDPKLKQEMEQLNVDNVEASPEVAAIQMRQTFKRQEW